MAKSYKHLFESNYEFPMKLTFRIVYQRKNYVWGTLTHQTLWEYCYINLREVYISTNKRTIMFQITVNNFELMKHWYTDDGYLVKGFFLSEALGEKFKGVLKHMNFPQVRVDIMNEHPLAEMVC